MQEYGRGRVIRALLGYSCELGIRAILATVREKIKDDLEREAYRGYIADCLWAIAKNTANSCGGSYFETKFRDGIKESKPEDNRTGDEIVADIIARAGIEVIA